MKSIFNFILRSISFLCLLLYFNLSHAEENQKPIFKLVKGKGVEVCEAYLNRLKATTFAGNDPTEARINEPLFDGFIDLKPIPLTAEEIQQIYFKIVSFDRYQDQDILEKSMEATEDKKDITEHIKIKVEQFMRADKDTPFVRYQTLLDMDNDGVADDIVIKNNNFAYIMDKKLQRINEERMKTIFADPELIIWSTIKVFPPLVAPIHIFAYHNKFYFDGATNLFMADNQYNVGIDKTKPVLLAVFVYEKYQKRKVCEYKWINRNSGENFTTRGGYYD